MIKILLLFTSLAFLLPKPVNAQTFTYNFSAGYDNWQGDFSDYPVGEEDFYLLDFNRTTLPEPLDTNKYSLMITGDNHSDDLFMFLKRKITGLLPNTAYELVITVEFASNAPTNAPGVGGAPGEGVTVKAGATLIEPQKIIIDNYYQMNIDKNDQQQPGEDMDVIGHVGVSDTTTEFTLITRDNETYPFYITTGSSGEVWVCIGTDSGYEAVTTLFYNQITLVFTSILSIDGKSKELFIYPNPVIDMLFVPVKNMAYSIIDTYGKNIRSGTIYDSSSINVGSLPSGLYFLNLENNKSYKFIKQ